MEADVWLLKYIIATPNDWVGVGLYQKLLSQLFSTSKNLGESSDPPTHQEGPLLPEALITLLHKVSDTI